MNATPTPGKDIPVFDADSHVIEPAAVWEEYLEPSYRVAARSAFWHEEGAASPFTVLNGHITSELYHPLSPPPYTPSPPPRPLAHTNIRRAAVWQPGMDTRAIGALDPGILHPVNAGATDPDARLVDMDRMGIDQALLFPTYFAEYFPLVKDPSVAAALARAYNNWVHELSQAAPHRIFPAAVLPMQEVNAAVRELYRVAKLGIRAAFIRPVFTEGRYPHHKYYYPLWNALEETGVLYCSHPSPGIAAPEMDCASPFIERVTSHLNIGHPVAEAIAPIMDNGTLVTGIMAEGLLERFPGVKLYLTHSKASWLHLYLEKTEGYLWLSVQEEPVSLEPEELFFQRRTLINYDTSESAIWEMPDLFEDGAAWGSFYPNHDTYTAWDGINALTSHGVSGTTLRKLMGENISRLLGVSLTPQL